MGNRSRSLKSPNPQAEGMLARAIETAFVFLLLAVVPFLSFVTTRGRELGEVPRSVLYLSASLTQWLLAGLGAGTMLATSRGLSSIGFRRLPAAAGLDWTLVLVVASLASMGLVLTLESWGVWPRETDLVYLLLPEKPREKLWCVFVLAPTAAICEEFLYRGYLLTVLREWLHSPRWGWVVSSAAFGMAHTYQGASGVVRAGLLGALLAYPVLRLGSLYPSMAAHLVIDAVALVWLGPALLRRTPSS
jgi:CAAX protease family protein